MRRISVYEVIENRLRRLNIILYQSENCIFKNQFICTKKLIISVLSQARVFRQLSETSQEVTNQEMQNAGGEFLEHIEKVSNDTDDSVIHRTLKLPILK